MRWRIRRGARSTAPPVPRWDRVNVGMRAAGRSGRLACAEMGRLVALLDRGLDRARVGVGPREVDRGGAVMGPVAPGPSHQATKPPSKQPRNQQPPRKPVQVRAGEAGSNSNQRKQLCAHEPRCKGNYKHYAPLEGDARRTARTGEEELRCAIGDAIVLCLISIP